MPVAACFEWRCRGQAAIGLLIQGLSFAERSLFADYDAESKEIMKKFAVLGYGTVGSGVVELFYKNRAKIEQKAGEPMDVGYILDLRDFPDSPYSEKFTKTIDTILADPEVAVVAECMGGVEPAYTYLMQCLSKGISVATSNKELIAQKGAALLAEAKAHSCNCFFEASVGGAIPIIRPLHRCLAANDISAVYGILNGTTNFILEKMLAEDMDFEAALSLAQELGYAERDPGADVDGHDACRKICIISSLVFGKHVYPDSVSTKGIRNISLADAEAADALDGAVKLIASVQRLEDGRILPMVQPMFVPHDNLLSRIDGVFNAVMVCGDGFDKAVFSGRGAGKLPTASAVLGDVIEAAKHSRTVFSQNWAESETQDFVADADALCCGMMIRTENRDAERLAELVDAYCDAKGLDGFIEAAALKDGAACYTGMLNAQQREELLAALALADCKVINWMPVLTVA